VVDDSVDEHYRHILLERLWGDGESDGLHQCCAWEMMDTARAGKLFGVNIVKDFTESAVWKNKYFFPQTT